MDRLLRLRLQYEDSRGKCDVCSQQGIVGSTLKLFDDANEAGVEQSHDAAVYYLRCADRKGCNSRVESLTLQAAGQPINKLD